MSDLTKKYTGTRVPRGGLYFIDRDKRRQANEWKKRGGVNPAKNKPRIGNPKRGVSIPEPTPAPAPTDPPPKKARYRQFAKLPQYALRIARAANRASDAVNAISVLGELARTAYIRPGGYALPAGWMRCDHASACTTSPDRWEPRNGTCLSLGSSCTGGQAGYGGTVLGDQSAVGQFFEANPDQTKLHFNRWNGDNSLVRHTVVATFYRYGAQNGREVPKLVPKGIVRWADIQPQPGWVDPWYNPIMQPAPTPRPRPVRSRDRYSETTEGSRAYNPRPARSPRAWTISWTPPDLTPPGTPGTRPPPPKITPSPEPSARTPPPAGTKEKKFAVSKTAAARVMHNAFVNPTTESLDVLEALHESLPKWAQARPNDQVYRFGHRITPNSPDWTKPSPQAMADAVFRHFDLIDWQVFAEKYFDNQAEDMAFGLAGGGLGKASATSGRPVGYGFGPVL